MSVPTIVKDRWRTGQLVGEAKHQLVVRVRRGYMNRLYQPMEFLDGSHHFLPPIWKGSNHHPWQGQWTTEGDWITVPQVQSAGYTKDVTTNSGATATNNGSSTATIVMDSVAFLSHTGTAGMYHTIDRGYFSPQRGVKVASRPSLWAENAWADVLNGGYQIEVWEGYGPDGDPTVIPLATPVDGTCSPADAAIARTFVGLIDECDLDSSPDQATITARDFGIFCTDQRVIYRNKAPEIRSPVVFADRKKVLGEKPAGYAAAASGTQSGYHAAGVLPGKVDDTGWISDSQSASTDMVWLEIKLPAGAYDQFYLATEAPGQEMYVAIDATAGTRWKGSSVSAGWITTGNAIPGAGHDYTNHYHNTQTGGKRFNLGGELQCAQGTTLRIYLTRLNNNIYTAAGDQVRVPGYVGNVFRLWGYRYGTSASSPTPAGATPGTKPCEGWVLVDDASDVIRMCLVWCGFHEWDVDNFGWSLDQPLVFGQDQFFTDVINAIQAQGDFLFFMSAPTEQDMSIGVPCFKKQRAFTRQPQIAATVRDWDLLEALQVTWDLSNLPYSFRVRGAANPAGGRFGQDLVKRFGGVYFPPWSGIDYQKISPTRKGEHMDHSERLAGLKRNYLSTQGTVLKLGLNSDAECIYAAVLTAVQYALQEATATFQVSGLPGVEVNSAVVVMDQGSGTNSRIWINSIQSQHSTGASGTWEMTFGGVLIDTEDLTLMAEDWAYIVFKYGMHKDKS
jgi:hypothetical protein